MAGPRLEALLKNCRSRRFRSRQLCVLSGLQMIAGPIKCSLNAMPVAAELNERIRTALNELPEQCRTIFQMSRFEGLKYQEIADELKLSVKTIENQMGKALKLMRLKLAEFLSLLISILLNI